MKQKIFFAAAVLLMATKLFSQQGALPNGVQLHNSMLQLMASAKLRFSNIDAGAMDASSPNYHRANFHIVQNSRNQLFLNADTSRDDYTEYFREEINAQQVNTEFNNLIQLFNQVVTEFHFLSKRDDTYGTAYYFYDLPTTLVCQLEAYRNPIKNNWSISLTLRHPTKSDLESVNKKLHPEGNPEDIIAQQKLITQTLTALLKGRVGKFKTFLGIELPAENGGKFYGVQQTAYGVTPGPVEFIDVSVAGATTYHLTASGYQLPVQLTVCYAQLITPDLEKEGYEMSKGDSKNDYTIFYKGVGISACRLDKEKGTVTIVIFGE